MRRPSAVLPLSALLPALLAFAALPARAGSPEDAALVASAYSLEHTHAPIAVKRGGHGLAHLKVTPSAGAHISPDAPITVTLAAGPAVSLPKAKLTRADVKMTPEQGVELDLPFDAVASGTEELKAKMVFYVCLKDLCERQKKDVSFTVAIE
jgi:hypothetical protein